jgi:hypothetical protein
MDKPMIRMVMRRPGIYGELDLLTYLLTYNVFEILWSRYPTELKQNWST